MHAAAADDNRLLRSIPAARVALIQRIGSSAAGAGAKKALATALPAQLLPGVAEEDLAAREPRQARQGRPRPPGVRRRTAASARPLVRVFNPTLERDGFESPAHAGADGDR